MFKQFQQSLSGLFWLIGLAALAIFLIFLLNGPPNLRVAQEPEGTETPTGDTSPIETPSPQPEETATPVLTATVALTPTVTETPTLVPTDTPTLLPPETVTPTLTPEVTPTSIPGDGPIPIEDAPPGEAILYTAYPQSAEGIWDGALRLAPISEDEAPVISFPITFPTEFEPMLDPIAAVSPNGRYILLLEPRFPGGAPYLFDRDTNTTKPLIKNYPWSGGLGFDWSADSQKVIFWTYDVGLWLIDVGSAEETTLIVPDGPVQRASISPAGQQFAFIGFISGNDKTTNEALWVIDTIGGTPRWLFDLGGSRNFGWSTEGILYIDSPSGPKDEEPSDSGVLWVTNAEGEGRRNYDVPLALGLGFEPRLSPDRTRLAFTGLTPGETNDCSGVEDYTACMSPLLSVYVLDLPSGQTVSLGKGIEPTWSPDGNSLAFISFQTGTSEVWLINTDGSGLRQLTNDGLFKQIAWWLKEGE